jgi:endonuclease-3 related protein
MFHAGLKNSVQLFNEYHALLVRLAKDFCRTTPRCSGCPLEEV